MLKWRNIVNFIPCFGGFLDVSPQPPIHLHPYFLVNEKYLGGTYMGQISFMPDMYFPSFQCSGVFQAAGNIILGCFWNVLLR